MTSSTSERTALNRLRCFAGGCDLHAAEHILEREGLDALDVIDTLDLWSTSPRCSPTPTTAVTCAIGCWRRSASTPRNDSKPAARHPRSAVVTPITLSRWPRPRVRGREAVSNLLGARSRPRDRQLAPPSTGRSRRRRRSMRCDWSPLMAHSIPIGNAAKAWAEMAIAIPDARASALPPTWPHGRRRRQSHGRSGLGRAACGAIGEAEARLGVVSATAFSGSGLRWRCSRATSLDARTKNGGGVTRSRRGGDAYELSQAPMRPRSYRRRPVARRWPGRVRKRPFRSPAPPESPPRWQHPSS
jgi:hypothetical protein